MQSDRERWGNLVQEAKDDTRLWEEPLEEEYWLALLHQGEHAVGVSTLFDEDFFTEDTSETNNETSSDSEPETQSDKPSEPSFTVPSWQQAQACLCDSRVMTLPVVGYNRGGLLVDWHGWQGFIPASQLTTLSAYLDGQERMDELAGHVGRQLDLKLIEIDQERNRLIFSEKAANSLENQVERLMREICPGDIRRGRVTNLCSFGVFIDLGGMEGLIHISELSWGRVGHPADVLHVGQQVEVYVLNIDREQKRIGLSLKRLQPDPWHSVEERYREGQMVQGVVTNVVSFGAFVRLEEGLEGLIHVSELAEGDFMHPRNVVKEGSIVTVRVLNIDSVNHRLGLSLRRVDDETNLDQAGSSWIA